jgi:tetratricopeptide (TPR) repeat protein
MIRIILIAFVLLGFTSNYCDAQDSKDALLALHKTLAEAKEDTSKVNAMYKLAQHHRFNNRNDSTVFYGAKVLQRSRALGMTSLEIQTLNLLGLAYAYLGDYAMKRSLALKSLKLSRLHGIEREEAIALLQLGIANRGLGNHELSKKRYLEAIPLFRKVNEEGFEILTESSLGMAYYELGNIDSAFICNYNALKRQEPPHGRPIGGLGRLHYYLGSLDSSMYYFNMHKQLYRYQNPDIDLWRGRIFNKQKQLDSAQTSVINALEWGLEKNDWTIIISSAGLLSEINESRNPVEALEYSNMALAYTDSLSQMRITNANENINS